MAWQDQDTAIRAAAFAWLAEQAGRLGSDVLPRVLLVQGFSFEGIRVPLLGPQGIFKPAVLADAPLTISTAPRVEGREAAYDDQITDDGLIYRYRGTDPNHRDNVGLRRAMERQLPLIYFLGLVPGQYLGIWPVYVVRDDRPEQAFTVQPDEPAALSSDLLMDSDDDARRAYALRLVRQRIHQRTFSQRVLLAYQLSCAVCRLHHRELLDAAHILPDGHPRGRPIVPNGLALCKLHHAAFDSNILGIRPDYSVEIRRDVLTEIDGPVLLHALQGVHNQRITVPRREAWRPSVAFLEERYGIFREAG
jgi:putative restriction endonuclease